MSPRTKAELKFLMEIISVSTTVYFVLKILQDTSPAKTNPR